MKDVGQHSMADSPPPPPPPAHREREREREVWMPVNGPLMDAVVDIDQIQAKLRKSREGPEGVISNESVTFLRTSLLKINAHRACSFQGSSSRKARPRSGRAQFRG